MSKTYASNSEVCLSNSKYRVIKFNFEYVPPKTPFGQRIFIRNIHNKSKWHLGSGGGGDRVVEAKEISIQLKTETTAAK